MTRAETTIWRTRLVAACLLISALCFRQEPGLIVPDTKLDLTANPGAFLARALTLWDDSYLGQLQNQAYGYFFPVGLFHAALDQVGLPAWIIQRAWWSVILCVAFVGLWRLATVLEIGHPWTRYLAALLFALSPRFLSEVAVTSVEVWPMAMAPWVLVPLVSPRPAPLPTRLTRAAVAYGLIGGVNAVATGAALVLPALWLLTRPGLLLRIWTFTLWLAACLLATLWWLVPLAVLGQYSPPFLDWIEDSAVTTGTASAVTALQGTTPWLSFLTLDGEPSWPTGWLFVTQPVLIVVTLLISVGGLLGLARRDLPWRGWLLCGLGVGLLALTSGFTRAAPGPFADQLRELLDGPLAPLRNLHKFELVIRIPLLLGLAHVLTKVGKDAWARTGQVVMAVIAAVFVVISAAPGLASALPRSGSYPAIPGYWHQTAKWLDDKTELGSVLIVPAAPFADFSWGAPRDEPLQALMSRPFVVRDAVPLGGAGSIRLLDEIERRLRSGSGSPELRRSLVKAGIRFVVVRNDLSVQARTAEPIAVHEALQESGIKRVALFGPPAGSPWETEHLTVDERTLLPYPSVEIFDAGRVDVAEYVPASRIRAIIGGPEDSVATASLLPGGSAGIHPADLAPLTALGLPIGEVLTDGLRRREVAFGRASNNTSAVLSAGERGRSGRQVIDYLPQGTRPLSSLDWHGVAALTASSSASDATASMRVGPGYAPAAAMDGDLTTRWVSGRYLKGIGEWLEVNFLEPIDLEGTTAVFSDDSPIEGTPTRVSVTTDRGTISQEVRRGVPWRLRTAVGSTTRLRITLESVAGGTASGFAVAELSVPGVSAQPRIVTEHAATGAPDVALFRVQDVGSSGCHFAGDRPLCAAGSVVASEEAGGIAREFSIGAAADYTIAGKVLPRPSAELARLLNMPGTAVVTSSSSAVPGAAGRAGTVLDDDLGTGWVAHESDLMPRLSVTMPERRRISGLQFLVDSNLAGSRPTHVTLDLGDGPVTRSVDSEGWVVFKPAMVDAFTVDMSSTRPTQNVDARTGFRRHLPIGISELRVAGAPELSRALPPGQVVESPCGFGPEIRLDDFVHTTRVRGTVAQLLRGEPLSWEACASEPVRLNPGKHVLVAKASSEFRPERVWLARADRASASARSHTPAPKVLPSAAGLQVPDRSEAGILVLRHNFNAGWSAHGSDGKNLVPVRVNGWQQGFVLPAGAELGVVPEYAPQGTYVWGLFVGLLTFGLVLAAAVVPFQRMTAVVPRRDPRGEVLAILALHGACLLNAGLVGAAAIACSLGVGVLARRVSSVRLWSMGGVGAVLVWLVAAQPWANGGAALNSSWAQFFAWLLPALAVAPATWRRPAAVRGRAAVSPRPSIMTGRSMNL
ncbi:DUF3367 domain-containing protein [Intrasporangium calvum]|uniref:DUF3367 domain-containing protein n=1 Tax=Intrasporangium calvum TaxID=53358 RepID=UPI000DF63A87|nr:DUF3367 domain-containing protein [Intrasporangium calvum]AXG13240.1 DUF3367 domain-containing protein [Intrasporangium calvum]